MVDDPPKFDGRYTNNVEVKKKDTFKYNIEGLKKKLQAFLNTLV